MKDTGIIVGMAVIAVVIGVVIFLNGGGSFLSPSSLTNNQQSAVIVPFTTLAEGPQSKIASRVNYLINTQEELTKLWEFLKEPPPVPVVDFNTKVVAAVFAGEMPTAGYGIAVAKVEDTNKRVVEIELIKPDESCVLAQSLTAPYQVIELPKTSLPFTHADAWLVNTLAPCDEQFSGN